MLSKKFLGTLAIGAFIFCVPVADNDMPMTNTVSAYTSSSEVRYREQQRDRAREEYEQAKRRYDRAKSSGHYSSSQLREMKYRRDRAKEYYEEAKDRYADARDDYRDNYDDRYRSRADRYSREERRRIYRNGGYLY